MRTMTEADVPAEACIAADPVLIRPVSPGDAPALLSFYESLSPPTQRQRFLASTRGLTPRGARIFCSVDHRHREGFVAVARDEGTDQLVGHLCIEPVSPSSAEIALAVADAHQRRGIGTRLLTTAVHWARDHGVRTLTATALQSNVPILRLLQAQPHRIRVSTAEGGLVEITIELDVRG